MGNGNLSERWCMEYSDLSHSMEHLSLYDYFLLLCSYNNSCRLDASFHHSHALNRPVSSPKRERVLVPILIFMCFALRISAMEAAQHLTALATIARVRHL